MAILGYQIGKELINALGLPKQTISFVLRVKADWMVTVECEYFPDDAPALVTALAEYTLTRKPERALPVAFNFDDWMRKRNDDAHRQMMARHRALHWHVDGVL